MTKEPIKFKSLDEVRTTAIDAHQNNERAKAQKLYQLYLHNNPNDAAIWSNLGALFRQNKDFELAAAAQYRALELDPDHVSFMNNAANAFYDAGHLAKALELREKIVQKDGSNPDNYASLGKCYRAVHQLDKAEKILLEGIKKFPQDVETHIQLSFVQLALGDYPNGFKTFDWRWKGDELAPPSFDFPQWKGEDLNGKIILIMPEQGFGDTVLMARLLPALKAMGCTIRFIVKAPLQRLFQNLKEHVEYVTQKSDMDGCDYWMPMMDLPLYLGATLDQIPPPADLHIPPASKERAKKIVGPFKDRFKVGVMWSGSVTYRANHKRSFSHDRFLDLSSIPDLQMFSLYKGPLLDDFRNDGTACIIVDASGSDADFADSAALMQELDLVISMDSAIVHVAGSLGVEVWNLLHSEAYWLYEPFADHTPWYPSMRLIVQPNQGDWDGTFELIKQDLKKRVKDWKNQ